MAELADALDLGSSGRPWGFKSSLPHQKTSYKDSSFCFLKKIIILIIMNIIDILDIDPDNPDIKLTIQIWDTCNFIILILI